MTALLQMREFLLTYPQWEQGGLLYIDYTDGVPGGAGLFPTGREELARRQDVLGNVAVDCRLNFILYRVCASPEDNEKNAQWLMDFQQWIERQSVLGLAPRFGDVPIRERLRAERGKYNRPHGESGIYGVQLTAEFTKLYEVNEHGEN